MKVAFDTTPLGDANKTRGVGSYAANLLQALQEQKGIEVLTFQIGQSIPEAEVVHRPYFDLFRPTLNINSRIPEVVTVHDLIPLKFAEHYPAGIRGSLNLWRQRRQLRKAARIITISECSKQDTYHYLKFPLDKISIIPLAAGDQFKPIKNQKLLDKVRQQYQLPKQFFIYAGSVNWNKNLEFMADAAVAAGATLVCAGKSFDERDNLTHPELQPFGRFLQKYANHPQVKILGFVPTEDLVALFNLATGLLFVSLYEGFGLPVLEAQACGLPVITSNASSLPEVGGEGVVYVDPTSQSQLVEQIQKLLSDTNLRQRLITAGFENVKRFSWRQTAEETINVYRQLV